MASPTLYLSPISLIVQYLTNVGLIAQGATLTLYLAGTSTLATTYTDSTGTVPNANPMTLSSTGRPVSVSGVSVAFWTPGGIALDLLVVDAAGNQLVSLLNVQALNDLTSQTNSLQQQLASASSANITGTGPVAGADLVANAMKSYDVFSSVRAANAPTPVTGQTLIISVQGASTVGDTLAGQFYWSATSTLADDSRNVLRPGAVPIASAGRWLRLLPLGVPVVVVKTADQSVVSTTALNADTQLSVFLVPGTWLVSMKLLLLGTGGTGQGYKVSGAFAGTITGNTGGAGVNSANGTAAAAAPNVNGTITAAAISSTVGDACNLDFVFIVATQGFFTVQFTQNSSSANATTVKAGSILTATRII